VANLKLYHPILTKLVSCSLAGISSLCLSLGAQSIVLAQSKADPTLADICEVDLSLLKSSGSAISANVVTADTISIAKMTVPSLWWSREQSPSKLIKNWIADRTHKQVYLIVNLSYWNILDYVDRYAVIGRFGRVSRDYGYSLKLCSDRRILLGEYRCDRVPNSSSCRILLNGAGQPALKSKN
jgi:hypothetical protein